MFAFCEDGDALSVAPADTLSLTIDGPFAEGLEVEDNLVLRAAKLLDPSRGAAIRLTKNLPVASGVGGGSADAAATLRLLSRMWDADLPAPAQLAGLGADVPACVGSTTVRGEGVGDVLTPLASLAGTPVLLINPGVAVSTAEVFSRWDGNDHGALANWWEGRNDLEPIACALYPAIGELLDWMDTFPGTTLVRMSGSGATCFALFDEWKHCDEAAFGASRDCPEFWVKASRLL